MRKFFASRHIPALILFLLATAFLLTACTGSKKYARKASKYEAAGMYRDAAENFYIAVRRKPDNIDARIGLKRTGQRYIDGELDRFYQAYSARRDREAVYIYREVQDFVNKCKPYVVLDFPPYYEEQYSEMLQNYMERRYEEASDLMYNEKFQEAEKIFDELLMLDPNYRDVSDMGIVARAEPVYRKGVLAFETGKYRTCYDLMNEVLRIDGNYKDAVDYKNRAVEKGRIVIAVLPFEYASPAYRNLAGMLRPKIISNLAQSNNPFIKVIDRKSTGEVLKQQRFNAEAGTNVHTGELLGANALLKVKILEETFEGGSVKRYNRQGFLAYKVEKYNPETKEKYYETRYKRVTYNEYSGSIKLKTTVSYQLVSAETGAVLFSDVENYSTTDRVNYATFRGDYRNLYAGKHGKPGERDMIYNSQSQKNALDRLFTTKKRTLVSKEELRKQAAEYLANRLSSNIINYNPDAR